LLSRPRAGGVFSFSGRHLPTAVADLRVRCGSGPGAGATSSGADRGWCATSGDRGDVAFATRAVLEALALRIEAAPSDFLGDGGVGLPCQAEVGVGKVVAGRRYTYRCVFDTHPKSTLLEALRLLAGM
jgi:hypothetical protein